MNKISAPYIIKQITKRAVWRPNLLLGILTPLNLMIETMCSADSQASPSDEMIRKRPRVKTIARRHHNFSKIFSSCIYIQTILSNDDFTNEIPLDPKKLSPFLGWCWWILEADLLFWGCMLMNSRSGPPLLRGGPPLGTISNHLAVHIECSKQFKWNLYFYVSGQSGTFWAVPKLL